MIANMTSTANDRWYQTTDGRRVSLRALRECDVEVDEDGIKIDAKARYGDELSATHQALQLAADLDMELEVTFTIKRKEVW